MSIIQTLNSETGVIYQVKLIFIWSKTIRFFRQRMEQWSIILKLHQIWSDAIFRQNSGNHELSWNQPTYIILDRSYFIWIRIIKFHAKLPRNRLESTFPKTTWVFSLMLTLIKVTENGFGAIKRKSNQINGNINVVLNHTNQQLIWL